jgi:D-3-phosphoglycerate dehydrogenase
VNFPNCSLERTGGVRVLVANRNVPNMLSQILSVLAQDGLNVEDMVNRHRSSIAYNIIDLSAACVSEESMSRLKAIDGVVMTRQICR